MQRKTARDDSGPEGGWANYDEEFIDSGDEYSIRIRWKCAVMNHGGWNGETAERAETPNSG